MDSDKPIIPPRPKTGVPRVSSRLPSPLEDNDAFGDKSSVSNSDGSKDPTEQKSDIEDQKDTDIETETPVAANVLMNESVPQEKDTTTDPIIPKRPERKKTSDTTVSNSSNRDKNLESSETKREVTRESHSPGLETSSPTIDDKELQKSTDDKHDLPKIPQRPSKTPSKSRPGMIGRPSYENTNLKNNCSTTSLSSNAIDTEINDIKEDENIEMSSPKVKPQEVKEDEKNEKDAGSANKEVGGSAHEVNDPPKDTFPDDREIPSDSEAARVNAEEVTDIEKENAEKENDDEMDKPDESNDTSQLPEMALVNDEEVRDKENVKENDDEKDKPNEASNTSDSPDAGDISRNVFTTSTFNAPSIPQRPRPKTIKSSKELSESEKSQPTNKPKAPPKPKNLSSKIAAFQEMLNQGTSIAPGNNKSVAVPKKDNATVQEGISGPSRLSSDRMKFAQSLQGLVGKGMAPEPIGSGPTENRVTSDKGAEMKTEKVTHITKSRGPKKKRLPGSLKNPAVLEAKTRFNITTSQLWVVDYKSHIDAEVNLPADNEEERGEVREEAKAKEEVTEDDAREEKVHSLVHHTGACGSDEQVNGDSAHSDDTKELSQPEIKPRSSSGEYDVEAPTDMTNIPDPRADYSLSGEVIDTGNGKDLLPVNTVCNLERTLSSGAKSDDLENHTSVSSNTLHKNDSASSLIDNYVDSQ
ncbi:Piso0_002235 [Millerozyma farinosa CBS 7064]|uniref:Piso0_002235 protein n=1 Tax=Pichia sorbitophila (strain ATCC MYA-4447 / BCRC 22081 / CBS 7064 / NBRC 10061 / NRRL Y-12695) TaxID=559304 RepID=G8YEH6_PICSO|nr:Piso0_002235 [Millerozyma farinosa CBS 7064]